MLEFASYGGKFGIVVTYGHKPIPLPSRLNRFTNLVRFRARGGWFVDMFKQQFKDADVVRFHSIHYPIPLCKKIMKKDSKIIMHYHGSELRDATPEIRAKQVKIEKLCDAVLLATEDLVKYGSSRAVWLPNPCDTERFNQKAAYRLRSDVRHNLMPETPAPSGSASGSGERLNVLRIKNKRAPSAKWLEKAYEELPAVLQGREYQTKLLERNIPYADMPRTLAKFDVYLNFVDIGYQNKERTSYKEYHSMLALQSLAMGLDVVGMDMRIYRGLPERHRPENVIHELDRIYQES